MMEGKAEEVVGTGDPGAAKQQSGGGPGGFDLATAAPVSVSSNTEVSRPPILDVSMMVMVFM